MHLRRIGADQAGIARKVTAPDQFLGYALVDDLLEHLTQQVTVTDAPMPVLGKGGMVGHRGSQIETAEPAIGEVQMDILTDPPFGSNSEAMADQQHADHQFGFD